MIAAVDENPGRGEPPTLFAILALQARRASDVTLASMAAIGAMGAVALVAVRPTWWVFAMPVIAVGAFGIWGMLERGIAERGARRSERYDRAVSVAQWIAVATGAIAAIATVFAVLGLLVGPFKS